MNIAAVLEFSDKNFSTISRLLSQFGYTSFPLMPPGKLGSSDLVVAHLGYQSEALFNWALYAIRRFVKLSTPVVFLVDYGKSCRHGEAYIVPMELDRLREAVEHINENTAGRNLYEKCIELGRTNQESTLDNLLNTIRLFNET